MIYKPGPHVLIYRFLVFSPCRQSSDFISKFRDYADESVHRDMADINAGAEEMKQLRQLIAESAQELEKSVTFKIVVDIIEYRLLYAPRSDYMTCAHSKVV